MGWDDGSRTRQERVLFLLAVLVIAATVMYLLSREPLTIRVDMTTDSTTTTEVEDG